MDSCDILIQFDFSTEFFEFCREQVGTELYRFVQKELCTRRALIDMSASQKPCGVKVASLFEGASSLLDCIKDWDCSHAYSLMQYLEGYFLIRQVIIARMTKGNDKEEGNVNIVFLLPNTEGRYYGDLEKDLDTMLELDFGEFQHNPSRHLHIWYEFFKFTDDPNARPYIDKSKNAERVKPEDMVRFIS